MKVQVSSAVRAAFYVYREVTMNDGVPSPTFVWLCRAWFRSATTARTAGCCAP